VAASKIKRVLPLALIVLDTTEPSLIPRLGDFPDWFRAGLGLSDRALWMCDARSGGPLPRADSIRGAILTGSAAMVTDREAWSVNTAKWLCEVIPLGVPVLGICYGHQLLADALGGRVDWNPNGREIGTIRVQRAPDAEGDPLFGGLPEQFLAQSSHSQSVVELPPGARIAAANPHDRHQAVVFTPRVFGVQFHPEFSGGVSRGYIEARRVALAEEGLDPDALSAACDDSPESNALLARFEALCRT